MIGVGVEDGKMDVRLLDPVPEEEGRPDLQKQLRDAHEAVIEARIELLGHPEPSDDDAPETLTAWTRLGDALHHFSDLIAQV